MDFGVSMGLYGGEIVGELEGGDIGEACLRILDDFIEFALKNGFRMIETGSASLIAADLLFPIAAEIKEKIPQFQEVTYHLPSGEINIAALHRGIRREAVEETKKHVILCQEIGISKVVMHPGCFATMPNVYLLMERETREAAKQSILEIFEYCCARNIELSIENLPHNEPFFQRPAEFEPFIEQGIGMVLDTVHALTSYVEPFEFIAKFGNRIKEVHLTDGFREEPISHYPVGTGEVNCLAVLKRLQEINYEGRIILEVDSKKDLLKSLAYLKEHQFF
jgi:sugar phosphate isomerase/epimerase